MIVAAALLDSCWERIDDASVEKLLSTGLFESRPIGQGPDCSMMGLNLGFVLAMATPILRDWASVTAMRGQGSHLQFFSLILAAYRVLHSSFSSLQEGL